MLAAGHVAQRGAGRQQLWPAGLWRTSIDCCYRARGASARARQREQRRVRRARVEKIFDQPDDDPAHLCKACEGERKDKPIIGMNFLWGLKKDGDQYAGGEILDPKNGKIYRAKMKLIDGRQEAGGAWLHRLLAVRPLADLGAGGMRRHG